VYQQMALDSFTLFCCVFVLEQVMSQWRAHVFHSKLPVKVGNTISEHIDLRPGP